MKFGNELLELLDSYGADAASDLNDGIEPYGGRFGWKLEYAHGDLVLEVFLLRHGDDSDEEYEDDELTVESWVLTPEQRKDVR